MFPNGALTWSFRYTEDRSQRIAGVADLGRAIDNEFTDDITALRLGRARQRRQAQDSSDTSDYL
jgi:hypothetical protein